MRSLRLLFAILVILLITTEAQDPKNAEDVTPCILLHTSFAATRAARQEYVQKKNRTCVLPAKVSNIYVAFRKLRLYHHVFGLQQSKPSSTREARLKMEQKACVDKFGAESRALPGGGCRCSIDHEVGP
jgi:hypothetical protein